MPNFSVDYSEIGRQRARLMFLYGRRKDEFGMTLPQDGPAGTCGCEICAKKNRKKKNRQPEVQEVKNA